LVELSCYGFDEHGLVSIHAPALQHLSIELDEEDDGRCLTLHCPRLKGLDFSGSESECKVLVKLGVPTEEQSIGQLNVSALDVDAAVAMVNVFKHVNLLAVRVGCIEEKEWRDMFDIGRVAHIVDFCDPTDIKYGPCSL
jgi:hypothetical protein